MSVLTRYQADIVDECIARRRGCICVPMGTGKTLIGLTIIKRIGDRVPALVVCSKTLLGSWVAEIEKFFGNKMRYQVYHRDYMKKAEFDEYSPVEGTDVVLTTPEVLTKAYTANAIGSNFTSIYAQERGAFGRLTLVKRYHAPSKPFLSLDKATSTSNAFLYALPWKCLIIDEVQQHTNITSIKCEAISAIFSRHRWATTGTPISEPTPERVMGYHFLIGDETFPSCIPDTTIYLTSAYPGLQSTMVLRTQSQADFTLPECSEHIVTHSLTSEESAIYVSLREVIRSLRNTAMGNRSNVDILRSVNAQLMSMILYTRQFLVCPLVPYSNLVLNVNKQSEMVQCFRNEISKLNLDEWLSNASASKSSRICKIIEMLNKHPEERCIVFSCFRTNLDVMQHYITADTGRQVFTIKSEHSSRARINEINAFESTENGILIMTYDIGAEGLNLQRSHIVMLADVWWNDSKISQAIARVLRRGQTHDVSVYIFTSNTGIEKSLYEKHIDKRTVINALMTGRMSGTVRKMNLNDVVSLLLGEETTTTLTDARKLAR